MLRRIAILTALAALVGSASAQAQGVPLRDLQYTDYLQKNDFDGQAVALACNAEDPPGISFRSSADQDNLRMFLQFLTVRPDDVSFFNNGQFSQSATALGEAVKNVCLTMNRNTEAEEESIFKPLTSYDPLIDGINLSEFKFQYRFQHDQPPGHLPLEVRSFPVFSLEVGYADDNFPDANGELWAHQTAVLNVTVNNYDYFRWPESDRPGAIRQENGSYPCYYIDPRFDGVYRFAWEDCNPETLVENAPPGMNLMDAVRLAAINFIEQNISVAGPPVKVENDPEAQLCCRELGAGDALYFYLTNPNECPASLDERFSVVPGRFCGVEDSAASFAPGADIDPLEDPIDPYGEAQGQICCQDYSGFNPNIFSWDDRLWCQNQNDHRVVPDYHCN